MEKEVSNYQLRVPVDLMKRFKQCLRKVYWEEEITINNGVIKLIKEFVDKSG